MGYEPLPDRRTRDDRRTAGTAVPTERRAGRVRRGGDERRRAVRRSLVSRRLVPDRRARGVAPIE